MFLDETGYDELKIETKGSFGGLGRNTDRQGRFRFERVNPDMPGAYQLVVKPTRSLQGRVVKLKPSRRPVRLRLHKGHMASGRLLDDATGQPIPNATVKASPTDSAAAGYRGALVTASDSEGTFRFDNLADERYWLEVEGAVRPNKIMLSSDGSVTYVYPDGDEQTRWEIEGGQQEPITMRVKLRPGGRLAPAPPNDR